MAERLPQRLGDRLLWPRRRGGRPSSFAAQELQASLEAMDALFAQSPELAAYFRDDGKGSIRRALGAAAPSKK